MQLSEKYYRLTEDDYLALCPDKSSHMNMGLWPASSLKDAQQGLVFSFIKFIKENSKLDFENIIDAGSGWGGTRKYYAEFFPEVGYLGINTSQRQIIHSRKINKSFSNTDYIKSDIERVEELNLPSKSIFISLEAAFHFGEKAHIIDSLNRYHDIDEIFIGDLLVEDEVVKNDSYLRSALHNAFSFDQYEKAFKEAGFTISRRKNIGEHVFKGWSEYLNSVDVGSFKGQKKILKQFQIGFGNMLDYYQKEKIQYYFIFARKK